MPEVPDFLLPTGLSVMSSYETELAKMEAARQELTNAEKLFDLPITMYPELLTVQREMRGLRQIYEIYKAQKVPLTPDPKMCKKFSQCKQYTQYNSMNGSLSTDSLNNTE